MMHGGLVATVLKGKFISDDKSNKRYLDNDFMHFIYLDLEKDSSIISTIWYDFYHRRKTDFVLFNNKEINRKDYFTLFEENIQ